MTSVFEGESARRSLTRGFFDTRTKLIIAGASGVVVIALFALMALAERSGPGDALHRFELSVAEPLAGAFRFTSSSRANYHHERLVERLVETRDVPLEIEGEERAALLAPTSYNIAHHANGVFAALEGRNDERAVDIAIEAVAILELYESSFFVSESDDMLVVGEAVDNARAQLATLLEAHRDQFTLPELEEMLVAEITVITDEAQSATPYTLSRVTESLYDILDVLGSGDVLGAYEIVYEIKVDLAKDRFVQTLLG